MISPSLRQTSAASILNTAPNRFSRPYLFLTAAPAVTVYQLRYWLHYASMLQDSHPRSL